MARLAWFTPWPPQRSGIAGRSAELVPLLADRGHAIDIFVDEQDPHVAPIVHRAPDDGPEPGTIRVQSAHDFVWRQARGQYDLAVYQLGNSRLHEFMWPYLFRWPGLTVLHDARLHHARGHALLRRHRFADYRAEFAWNHPEVSRDVAELGVKGFDGAYYYQWPMVRGVVESSRVVASHSRGAAQSLQHAWPEATIAHIALGEGTERADLDGRRRSFRNAHGLEAQIVFGVFGALTADKRVPQVLRAFAATRAWMPDARLLLVGQPDPALDLEAQMAALGLTGAACLVPSPPDDEFDAAIAACDVSLNLRWPTALETSGPWLRSLALGRATVIIDLAHQADLPVLDPRTWHRHLPCNDSSRDADARAVAVAIDVLDEDHSLQLAMRRLAADEALREGLGREGRHYWEREHTVARMLNDYERVIAIAIDRPAPRTALPDHLRPDPARLGRTLLADYENFVDY